MLSNVLWKVMSVKRTVKNYSDPLSLHQNGAFTLSKAYAFSATPLNAFARLKISIKKPYMWWKLFLLENLFKN